MRTGNVAISKLLSQHFNKAIETVCLQHAAYNEKPAELDAVDFLDKEHGGPPAESSEECSFGGKSRHPMDDFPEDGDPVVVEDVKIDEPCEREFDVLGGESQFGENKN